jgi:hypothetical protein
MTSCVDGPLSKQTNKQIIQQRPQSQPLVTHIDKLQKYEGLIPTDWIDRFNSSSTEFSDGQDHTDDSPTAQHSDPNLCQENSPSVTSRPKRTQRQLFWLRDNVLETQVYSSLLHSLSFCWQDRHLSMSTFCFSVRHIRPYLSTTNILRLSSSTPFPHSRQTIGFMASARDAGAQAPSSKSFTHAKTPQPFTRYLWLSGFIHLPFFVSG